MGTDKRAWHHPLVTVAWSLATVVFVSSQAGADSVLRSSTPPLAAWTELGPSGITIVRAITEQAQCPSIELDTASHPLQVRAQPSPPAFPVLVCETVVPPGTGSATINGQPLPLPKPAPHRIVVIGDTGCRLKTGLPPQACNDPQAWPFAKVARSAATWAPDLVIHVGDYFYREAPCPAGSAECAGSPWGNHWDAWRADFFEPASPLLRAVPWVLARGNHERCGRAGEAWFRFLDPHSWSPACQDYTAPYGIPLGEVQLLVLDSANAEDDRAPGEKVAAYAAQFTALQDLATTKEAWLLMHHPLWGVGWAKGADKTRGLTYPNATLQAAAGSRLPPHLRFVLSGHLHTFELLSFAHGRSPQLVVGSGGTELLQTPALSVSHLTVAGELVVTGMTLNRFGYLTLEWSAEGWVATARGVDGEALSTCLMRPREMTACTAQPGGARYGECSLALRSGSAFARDGQR